MTAISEIFTQNKRNILFHPSDINRDEYTIDHTCATYITSALPYVNNELHVGNIVGCLLPADIDSRYHKKWRHDVYFASGTDESGTTTEIKAKAEGVSNKELCDKYYSIQLDSLKLFCIECDSFGRTSSTTQALLTQKIFTNLFENGHIAEQTSVHPFCSKCSMCVADRYVNGKCYHPGCGGNTRGDECDMCSNVIFTSKLSNKTCSQCGYELVDVERDHLYLKLEDFRETITNYFVGNDNDACSRNKVSYMSKVAINITKDMLSKPLENRCITRDLEWGISIPQISGLEKYWSKVFYVWFDAPIGYLSIIMEDRPSDWFRWVNPNANWHQFMAKDNVSFHTIMFPATLLGSHGPFGLVTHLSATNWLDYEGQKISKSKGVGMFASDVAKFIDGQLITVDYFRYYLTLIRPESDDSSFNMAEFARVIMSELCGKIGNYVNRVTSLTKKYSCPITLMNVDFSQDSDTFVELVKAYCDVLIKYDKFEYKEVIRSINTIAEIGNGYMQRYSIWNDLRLGNAIGMTRLANCAFICWLFGTAVEPVMPISGKNLQKWFSMNDTESDPSYHDVLNTLELLSSKPTTINIDLTSYQMMFKNISI